MFVPMCPKKKSFRGRNVMNPEEVRFDGATVHFEWPSCKSVAPPTTQGARPTTQGAAPNLGMRKPDGNSNYTQTQQDPGSTDTANSLRPMFD